MQLKAKVHPLEAMKQKEEELLLYRKEDKELEIQELMAIIHQMILSIIKLILVVLQLHKNLALVVVMVKMEEKEAWH